MSEISKEMGQALSEGRLDWRRLEKEVVARIRLLAATAAKLEPVALREKVCADLVWPNVALLGEFIMNVTIDDEDEGPAPAKGR